MARTCNLIVIVLDAMKPLTHKRIIERELEGFGIRLNKKAPAISKEVYEDEMSNWWLAIKKKPKGGVTISKNVQNTKIDDDFVWK